MEGTETSVKCVMFCKDSFAGRGKTHLKLNTFTQPKKGACGLFSSVRGVNSSRTVPVKSFMYIFVFFCVFLSFFL